MNSDKELAFRIGLVEGFLTEAEQDFTLKRWRSCVDNAQLSVENATPSLVPEAEEIMVDGKTVVLFTVPQYPIKPVSCRGRYFKRLAHSNHALELQEISNLYLQSFNTSWDCYPANHYLPESISLEKVNRFIDRANTLRGNAIPMIRWRY